MLLRAWSERSGEKSGRSSECGHGQAASVMVLACGSGRCHIAIDIGRLRQAAPPLRRQEEKRQMRQNPNRPGKRQEQARGKCCGKRFSI